MRYAIVSLLCCLLPTIVPAQTLNKCTLANGKVEYTNSPCASGKQSTLSVVDNAIISGDVARDEARQLRQIEDRRRGEATPRRATMEGRPGPDERLGDPHMSSTIVLKEREKRAHEIGAAKASRPRTPAAFCTGGGNVVGSQVYTYSVCR